MSVSVRIPTILRTYTAGASEVSVDPQEPTLSATITALETAYPGLSARLQVHGDRGSAVIDDDQLAYFHATPAGTEPEERLMGTTQTISGGAAGATASSNPGQLSDAHRLQYLNFLGALDGTEQLRVDLATNRQSIGVITGAYESARTGRPVRLS